MNNFTFKSKYAEYKNSFFQVGSYGNKNLAVEIWSAEDGPISRVTVNPGIMIPRTQIAIKDYSENEGMVDFLKSEGLIEDVPVMTIPSGWIEIPVYNLTDKGKEVFRV